MMTVYAKSTIRPLAPRSLARLHRRALIATTALAGSVLLASPAVAASGDLPDVSNAGGATLQFLRLNNSNVEVNGNANNGTVLQIDLNGSSKIMVFNTYDISAGFTVRYISGTGTGLVAVNRVTGTASNIQGAINASNVLAADQGGPTNPTANGNPISVWLINEQGVTFGGNATYSGGSLVLSTLEPDFGAVAANAISATTPVTFAGPGTGSILIGSGSGAFTVTGSIIAVGQDISVNRALGTSTGSIALVAGTDVTFGSGIGSPLSFTVNAGTTLGTAAVDVNANLTGQSVVIAGALQNALTDGTAALLNVASGVTLTATANDGAVILATKDYATSTDSATFTSGVDAKIASAGDLVTTGTNGTVLALASDSLTLGGNVTATGDFTAEGLSVTLGTAGQTRLQQAKGAVHVTASGGDVTGLGTLTLQSDSDGTGAADLQLIASTGVVNFGSATTLMAGNGTTNSDVILTSQPTITLGDVIASSLSSNGSFNLTSTGAITTGDLTLDNSLTVISTSDSVTTGDITIKGLNAGLSLLAAGATSDISTGALKTNRGDILASAGRAISLASASTALNDPANAPVSGTIALYSGTSINTGALIAGEDIAAKAGTTFTGTTATAGDDLTIEASDALSLASATVLGTGPDAFSIAFGATPGIPGSISFALETPALAGANLVLTSTGSSITSTGTLSNSAGGIVVDAFTTASLHNLSADGAIDLDALGALTVDGDVSTNGAYTANGSSVTLGKTGETHLQEAAGAVTITASSGDVTGLGTLTLQSDSNGTGAADLQLIASTGVVNFGSASTLMAGNGTTNSDVILTSQPTITLGDVIASSLSSNGSFNLTSTGAITTGDLTLDSSLRIVSTSGNITTGAITTKTNGAGINLFAGGATSDISTGALKTNRGDILASAGRAISLASASTALNDPANAPVSGTIALYSGTSINTGALIAGEDIAALAGTTFTATSATAGDDITITASGDISLANATVLGTGQDTFSVVFGATPGIPGAISFAGETPALAGANLSLTSTTGGLTSTGTLSHAGTGNVAIDTAGAIDLNILNVSNGSLSLTSLASISATTLAASDNITVDAGTFAALDSATATSGALTVTAGTDATVNTGAAGTLIDIGAGGSIFSNTSLTTTSGDVLLDATDDISVAAVTANSGNANLTANTGSISGSAVSAGGDVNALAAIDVTLGSALAGGILNVDAIAGDATVNTGSAGSLIDIDAGGSIFSNTSLTTTSGDILLDAGDDISVAAVTANGGNANLTANTGSISGSAVSAGGDVNALAAIDVTLGSASAGGILNVDAIAGDATVNTGSAGSLIDIDAGGSIFSNTSLTTTSGDILLDAGDDITIDDLTANGGNAALTAATGSISATGVGADLAVTATAAGDVSIGTTSAGSFISVSAGNDALLGTSTAGGSVTVTAGRDASLTDTTAGSAISVTAGRDALLTKAQAATSLGVSAGANATVQNGSAGSLIDIDAGGSIFSNTSLATTSGDVLLNAGNSISVNAVAANGGNAALTATAGSISATGVSAGLGVTATAAGDVAIGSTSAGSFITVSAGNDALLGTSNAGGNVSVTAGRDAALTSTTAGGSIIVSAGRDALLTTAQAGTILRVTTGRDTTVTTGRAGSLIDLNASGTITSGNLLQTTSGDITLDATGAIAVETLAANGGSAALTSTNGSVSATTLGAGVHVTVSAATDANLGATNAGSNVSVTVGSNATLGSTTAGGSVSVSAGGNASLGTTNASSSVGVTAGTNATLGSTTAGGGVGVSAGNDASLTTTTAGAAISVTSGRDATLGSASTGTTLTVNAGRNAAVNIGSAGSLINIDAGGSITSGTSLTTSAGAIQLDAANDITVETLAANGGAATLTAGGDIGGTTVGATGALTATAGGNASFGSASGSTIAITAGGNIGVGSATSGSTLTASAGNDAQFGSITAGSNVVVTSGQDTTLGTTNAGGAISVTAGRDASLTTSTAGTGIAVTTTRDAFLGTATAGSTLVVRSLGNATVNSGAASSLLDIQATGDIASSTSLSTSGGDILVNAGQSLAIASASATGGTIALLAGTDIAATGSLTASEDIAAHAVGDASFAAMTAGDDIEVFAGGTIATTGAVSIGGSASGLDARHVVFTPALAGQAGGIAFVAGDAATDLRDGRNIILEAQDVSIGAALSAPRVILRNNARNTDPATLENSTVIGEKAITTGDTFEVDQDELDFISAGTLIFDSGMQNVELGTATYGNDTGSTDLRILGTGTIELTGALTLTQGPARTMQIGGTLGDVGDDAAGAQLAAEIIARTDVNNKASIDAPDSTIELRGTRILFGTNAMVEKYRNLDNTSVAADVGRASSEIYSDAAAQAVQVFLRARQMTVAYSNFALFQNTKIGGSQGVVLNDVEGGVANALALRLISTGNVPDNSFAIFGEFNGFFGTSAAALTNLAIEISNPGGDPNNVRINRAASRLNGCIIGSPDKGCLITDVSQPNFEFYDERKSALFDATEDSTIAVSPLVGRGNDGLIVNVGDNPVGIDTLGCDPKVETCGTEEGK